MFIKFPFFTPLFFYSMLLINAHSKIDETYQSGERWINKFFEVCHFKLVKLIFFRNIGLSKPVELFFEKIQVSKIKVVWFFG